MVGQLLIEPTSFIFAGLGPERGMDFPEILRDKSPDLLLPVHQNTEGRGLNPSGGGEEEAASLGIQRRQRPGGVDAHQPVTLRTRLGRLQKRHHLFLFAKMGESVLDRLLGHRLQPQPLDRFFAFRSLHHIAKDQLPFAAGVTGIYHSGHVLALEQFFQQLKTRLGPLNHLQQKIARNQG